MSTQSNPDGPEAKTQAAKEAVEQARTRLASAEGTLAHVEYAMQADPTLNLEDWHTTCKTARDEAQAALTRAEEALRLAEQPA